MNKKLIIGIAAALVVIGSIIAFVATRNKDDNNNDKKDSYSKEVDTYTLTSATTGNTVTFEFARDAGYQYTDSGASGVLYSEEQGQKVTFYYKHGDKKNIISGELSYGGNYHDYSEFELNGLEANRVYYAGEKSDYRMEVNMVFGESKADKGKYDGLCFKIEQGANNENFSVQEFYDSEDFQYLIKSIKFHEKAE